MAPAELKVLSLDVALPVGARIGYVGGGSDNVGAHLRRLGLDVTELRLRTRTDAARPSIIEAVERASFAYLAGGDPDVNGASAVNRPARGSA